MDRRSVVAGIVAAGLAAPAMPRPASAAPGSTPSNRPEAFQHVSLFLPASGRTVALSALYVIAGGLTLHYDMQGPWQRFAASRADLSDLPLLGGLTRPPVARRMRAMSPAGQVLLAGTTLFLVLDDPSGRPPAALTIVNAGNEFAAPRPTAEVTRTDGLRRIEATRAAAHVVAPDGVLVDEETGEFLALIPPGLRRR